MRTNLSAVHLGVGVALLLALTGAGCQLLTEPLTGGEPRPLLLPGRSPLHQVYGSALIAARAAVGAEAVIITQGNFQDMAGFTAGPDTGRQTIEFTCRLDMGGRWYLNDCRPLPSVALTTESWPRPGAPLTRVAFPEIERLPSPEYAADNRPALAAVLPDDPTWRLADANLRRMLDALRAGDAAMASHFVDPDGYCAAYYELFSPAALAGLRDYAVRGYGVSDDGMFLFAVELQRVTAGIAMAQDMRCKIALTERGLLVLGIGFGRPRAGAAAGGV